MKKGLKIGIIVLVVIIGCGIIFGSIDKKRALESFRVSISENTTEMEIEKLFKVLEDI